MALVGCVWDDMNGLRAEVALNEEPWAVLGASIPFMGARFVQPSAVFCGEARYYYYYYFYACVPGRSLHAQKKVSG